MKPLFEAKIFGIIPSKKNSKQIRRNFRTGKPFISSSDEYNLWESRCISELGYTGDTIESPCSITVLFSPENKRKFDLSNKFESIADMLVKAGVIKDDNYTILESVLLLYNNQKEGYTEVGIYSKQID